MFRMDFAGRVHGSHLLSTAIFLALSSQLMFIQLLRLFADGVFERDSRTPEESGLVTTKFKPSTPPSSTPHPQLPVISPPILTSSRVTLLVKVIERKTWRLWCTASAIRQLLCKHFFKLFIWKMVFLASINQHFQRRYHKKLFQLLIIAC
jgi:hypothetical protein